MAVTVDGLAATMECTAARPLAAVGLGAGGKDVSFDVFPGVTWDSKADGYRKASWLWRLFRWE